MQELRFAAAFQAKRSRCSFFSLQAPATTVTIWGRVDDQLELLVLAGVERGSQRCRGCFGLKEMLLLSVWMASAGGGLAAGLLMAGGYQLLLVWGLGALVFVQKYRRMDRSLFTGLKKEERLISVEEEELAVHGATTYCE
ncbi:hypothetical protein POTOM_001107 [Populus tomentosa]|uniref:Uncharacterized protein n=1 Tax=Populus tomentosa TaxID=118781 RepID=A0A8X8IUW7_POPTO|nr:hypothetical protein POTOM_001107 [Populus tomentosa]